MRRKDREVTDPAAIDEIIRRCDCCRLGLRDGDEVYIVPLNFGFFVDDGVRKLYFHSAPEGRKIDLIKQRQQVGFEMDTAHALLPGDTPCSYTYRYQSVIGQGRIRILSSDEEKIAGLNRMMDHYCSQQREQRRFVAQALERVEVLELEITTLSCKEHL